MKNKVLADEIRGAASFLTANLRFGDDKDSC
jgi:hypothetical protein